MHANSNSSESNGINRTRLFSGICLALIPTGASFALIANVLGQLKEEFILTNAHVGFIAGSAIWGMAVSLLVLGPLLEGFGLKKGTVFAFLGHLTGLLLMLAASPFAGSDAGFWMLMLGAVILAMGHGMIEVSGNPLTAALYPGNKTLKLNWFHAFFPIGILVGSLVGWGLGQTQGVAGGLFYHWTFQLGIIAIPVIVYGLLVLPQKFPRTENADAGLPVGEMFRYTLTHPLMYLMLLLMAIAISVELGAGRWIPEVFARVGVPGILLMSWFSLIMVVLRLNAGYFINKFTPPGILTIGGVFMALGLFLFAIAEGTPSAFLAATSFGVGVAFFFPTIVGIVAERLPKSGSLGIVLTCGFGLAAAGAIGTPGIGYIGDSRIADFLNEEERRGETVALLTEARDTLRAEYLARAVAADDPFAEFGHLPEDIELAIHYTEAALENYEAQGGQIVGNATPQALRAILSAGISGEEEPVVARAEEILNAGEAYGGQRALLLISWMPLILVVVFGAMFLSDRRKGGYAAVRLERAGNPPDEAAEQGSKPIPAGAK